MAIFVDLQPPLRQELVKVLRTRLARPILASTLLKGRATRRTPVFLGYRDWFPAYGRERRYFGPGRDLVTKNVGVYGRDAIDSGSCRRESECLFYGGVEIGNVLANQLLDTGQR